MPKRRATPRREWVKYVDVLCAVLAFIIALAFATAAAVAFLFTAIAFLGNLAFPVIILVGLVMWRASKVGKWNDAS